MGQTIIQKIFQAHSPAGTDVTPGNIIWLDLDVRTARDFAGANVVQNYRTHYGDAPVADKSKTFFTFDLVVPAKNIPYANNQQICRIWAREQGVKVYDVDAGIGSHVAIEEGLAYPGSTFVGTDSHLNILGAVGAFGQGMGDKDIALTFKSGKTWFEVPPTMKVIVKGRIEYPCTARDLTLAVLRQLGSKGALGRAIEFYGPAIEELDLAGRITLASQVTEMAVSSASFPPRKRSWPTLVGARDGRIWNRSTPTRMPSTSRPSRWTSPVWSRSLLARRARPTSCRCAEWPVGGWTPFSSAPAPTGDSRISPPSPRWYGGSTSLPA
jgi:3-isopropylmalate/(R)-2-methylmalate dehydratase large subunit